MIYYSSPYSIGKDLGKAYNEEMNRTPDPESWVCFTDGDCQFLTSDYGHQLQEIINKHPDTGMFTCYTNRVGNLQQCYNGIINQDPNILNHKRIALQLQKEKRTEVKEINNIISGMLMLIKKSTWDLIHGAPEELGLLSIDNHISQRVLNAGMKIRLMEGVYIFHFYRLDTGVENKSHLTIGDLNDQQLSLRRRRKKSRFI